MKINTIQIKNFRLLKDFKIDLEDDLSLVIGKNNTGKTSILAVLDKFINSDKMKFSAEDFNLKFKSELKELIENPVTKTETAFENNETTRGIKLRLIIEYFKNDDLSNLSSMMMNLDPENNFIVLGFDFVMDYTKYLDFRKDYNAFREAELKKVRPKTNDDISEKYLPKDFNDFFKNKFQDYFILFKSPLEWDIKSKKIKESKLLTTENFKEIINFKQIKAKREVNNKETDKTLSRQTSEIYKREETSAEQAKKIEEFTDELSTTDRTLTKIYDSIFSGVIEDIKRFGGLNESETKIQIHSTLQQRELLEGNTTVMYTHDGEDKLPEHHNGLGYMNLISLIFDIKIRIEDFKRSKNEKPSDINLLFIEEPEAHTHPQMQYVFIKNIKNLLGAGINKEVKNDEGSIIKVERKLQYIVSTHSSHIVADCKYNDVKYLKKEDLYSVNSKNLKDLEREYEKDGEEKNYRFLKQYLTLNRAELFFADKAIFIEGDTERILLPAMMKKIDYFEMENPLLSQNISIVEVGAHSKVFEKFIHFIGIKALIITDIDTSKKENRKSKSGKTILKDVGCRVKVAEGTTNSTLKFFFKTIPIEELLKLNFEEKRFVKITNWSVNHSGNLQIAFQTEESGYHAKSFEDSFFHINNDFIVLKENVFTSLTKKWFNKFKKDKDAFVLADKGVIKKPSLAIEILLNSKVDNKGQEFSNWQIPAYIKEGLLWLKQN